MTARPASDSLARLPLLFLAVLLFAAPAWAQFDTAQVSGAIQDSSGAVLPGVDVVLVAVGTGLERRAVTNEAGLYTFPNVPVGDYRINATLSGFKPVARTGVRVNAGVNIRVDIQLEIGGLAETVQVEAATTLVDTGGDRPHGARRTDRGHAAQLAPRHAGGAAGARHRSAATWEACRRRRPRSPPASRRSTAGAPRSS